LEFRHEIAGIYETFARCGELNCALWTAPDYREAVQNDIDKCTKSARHCTGHGRRPCWHSDEERHECRLYLMGVRDVEDHRTVRCKIDRRRNWIQTTALESMGGIPIPTPFDSHDENAATASVRAVIPVTPKIKHKVKVPKRRVADNEA
jgi:hypothetical protein